MTFARVWLTGLSNSQPATGPSLTQLDLNVSRSVDGFAGGKSQPTAKIIYGGTFGFQVGDTNENTPLVTKDAKWLGAALDLSALSDFNFGGIQDACGPKEGRILVVTPSTNDTLLQSYDGGQNFEHNVLSTSDFYQCIASTLPHDGSGNPNGIPGTVVIGCSSANMYYALGTTNYTPYLVFSAGGAATGIDAIHYDTVNNQFISIGKTAGAPYLATINASGIPAATPHTVPASITGSSSGLRVAQNPINGRMVASWAGQTKVAYSDDGITWTASTTTLTSASYALSFGDGVFLAIDTTATSNIWKSSDGVIWSTSGLTMPGGGTQAMGTAKALTCFNGIFFVAYPSGQNYYSLDQGATWHHLEYLRMNSTPTKFDVTQCVKVIHDRLYVLQTYHGGGISAVSRSRKLGSFLGGA